MNVNMTTARKVVAHIASEHWGWEWKDPKYIDTRTDEQVFHDLVLLAQRTHSIRQVYVDMIRSALKALDEGNPSKAYAVLDWRESMGK